jgi:multimeric flavodoxin WrbA
MTPFAPNSAIMNLNLFPYRGFAVSLLSVTLLLRPALGQTGAEPATPAETNVARVLVAYDSLTGNTEKMAQGVVAGAKQVHGVAVVLKPVDKAAREDLEKVDGIILGCPTYYGTLPGRMKVVIDDWSWKLKVDFTDKVGGAFSTGGGQAGGKEFVLVSLVMFMLNNRMVVAGPLYQNDETGSVWAVPVSVLTIDTLRQRAAGKAERLKAGGPSREVEIGRAAACFFVPDWPCELRYRLLPSDKTVTA